MVGFSFVFHSLGPRLWGYSRSSRISKFSRNGHFWKDPFSKRPLFAKPAFSLLDDFSCFLPCVKILETCPDLSWHVLSVFDMAALAVCWRWRSRRSGTRNRNCLPGTMATLIPLLEAQQHFFSFCAIVSPNHFVLVWSRAQLLRDKSQTEISYRCACVKLSAKGGIALFFFLEVPSLLQFKSIAQYGDSMAISRDMWPLKFPFLMVLLINLTAKQSSTLAAMHLFMPF